RVMIKDGQTLVIAGLIKKQWNDTKKKVPFFGDIPIMGLAFQKSEKTLTKTELIIFITPHVIQPEKVNDADQLGVAEKRFEKKK
ncbi:MAG TPA: type II secretion system protein GspD, partial [Candidatus Omnitrophota bacterium]|nr:type II secretion system protein GspD [Candidatus Omnitrophota bacterium]